MPLNESMLLIEPVLLRVVCLGDSITGPHPRQRYHHQFLKFSDLLQLMLEARLGVGRALVLNRGFAGQDSGEGLARVQEDVLEEKPHIAIVLLGGNDRNRDGFKIVPDLTRENLRTIYSLLQGANIKTLALQYPSLPPNDASQTPPTAWHWLDKNNALIAEVAVELGVPTLDMAPAFQDATLRTPREELVNALDGVHLNPGGELVFARAIFRRLDGLGWI